MDAQALFFQTQKNNEDIAELELSVYGDGNGNKGLIRRVDALEHEVKFIQKQNWAIIAMLLGLYAEFIRKLLVP